MIWRAPIQAGCRGVTPGLVWMSVEVRSRFGLGRKEDHVL